MEWKKVKIGDVCRIKHGFAFKGIHFVDTPQKYVCVTPGNFTTKGGFKNDKPKFYNGPIPEDYILKEDDLIVTMTDLSKAGDSLGYSALVPHDDRYIFLHNQRIGLVTDISKDIDKHFLYWVMRTFGYQKYIVNHCSGSTVKHTSPSSICSYNFECPTISYQKLIAKILDDLDDKIENNNRINRNLEAQAQALFKSWFVDFEPWGGTMPEDWKEGTLGDIIAEIESGSRPKGGAQISGIPSIGAEKIERFGIYDFSGEKYVSEEFFNKMKRGHVNDGDVMLYKDGAYTGKCSMALDGFPYKECAVNEHVFLLRTEEAKYQFYLYLNMIQESVRSMIYTLACSKAAQPGLNTSEVLGVKTIIPTEAVMMDFNSKVANMMHTIANNCLESQRLAALRDTLLPKLMRGEIEL